jgi:hypothetical protein
VFQFKVAVPVTVKPMSSDSGGLFIAGAIGGFMEALVVQPFGELQ